jgi:hypothetical protein
MYLRLIVNVIGAPEGHAKFVVPCPGCIGGDSKADESLVCPRQRQDHHYLSPVSACDM